MNNLKWSFLKFRKASRWGISYDRDYKCLAVNAGRVALLIYVKGAVPRKALSFSDLQREINKKRSILLDSLRRSAKPKYRRGIYGKT